MTQLYRGHTGCRNMAIFEVGVNRESCEKKNPIGSMYGIFTYIWLKFMVNVAKYTIHGRYGNWLFAINEYRFFFHCCSLAVF